MIECGMCGKEINLDPTEPTDHDGIECPQCGGYYCYECGGWTVVDDEDICKDCAEEARRSE